VTLLLHLGIAAGVAARHTTAVTGRAAVARICRINRYGREQDCEKRHTQQRSHFLGLLRGQLRVGGPVRRE